MSRIHSSGVLRRFKLQQLIILTSLSFVSTFAWADCAREKKGKASWACVIQGYFESLDGKTVPYLEKATQRQKDIFWAGRDNQCAKLEPEDRGICEAIVAKRSSLASCEETQGKSWETRIACQCLNRALPEKVSVKGLSPLLKEFVKGCSEAIKRHNLAKVPCETIGAIPSVPRIAGDAEAAFSRVASMDRNSSRKSVEPLPSDIETLVKLEGQSVEIDRRLAEKRREIAEQVLAGKGVILRSEPNSSSEPGSPKSAYKKVGNGSRNMIEFSSRYKCEEGKITVLWNGKIKCGDSAIFAPEELLKE